MTLFLGDQYGKLGGVCASIVKIVLYLGFFLAGFWSIAGEISTSRHPSTPAFTNERQFMYMGGRGRRLHAEMSVSVGSSGPYRMLTRTSC